MKKIRRWNLFVLFVVLATTAIACGSATSQPAATAMPIATPTPQVFPEFMDKLRAGANCGELFDERNSADPNDPVIDRINTELSFIGCYSSSSVRTDLVGETADPLTQESSFTVKEYRLYRSVIDAPLSVPEDQAIRNAAEEYDVTSEEALRIVEKVMLVLSSNGWYGRPEAEIRHSSDWQGETR